MINYVFRPKRKVGGRTTRARLYSGRYRLDGDVRITEVPLKTSDKQVAQKILNDFVKEKEQERAGVIPPKNLRKSALQPMAQHLADYLTDMRNVGRDDVYVENLGYRLNILIRDCGWSYPPRITAESFKRWWASKQKATKTLNQYLDSANALLNWMIRNERITKNPLGLVEKLNVVPAWKRRAFSDDEFARFLKIVGESRIGVLCGLYTGFRRAELDALRKGDVKFDADVPHIFLDGQFTKNGKDAKAWLHPVLAKELRGIVRPGDDPSDKLLTGKMLPSMWKWKKDLKLAGIAWENENGRLDFHSLRHTLATNLVRQNVAPRIAQEILRHSDIRLTMNLYTDSSQLPVAETVQKLPEFGLQTDTQIHPQTPDFPCNQQSSHGTVSADKKSSKVVYPEEFWRKQTPTDVEGHLEPKYCLARTRT